MSSGRRYYRYGSVQLDCAIGTCAVATIVATILLFTDFSGNIRLVPVIFGFAALMNGIRAVKFVKRKEKIKYISAIVQSVLLIVLCGVTLVTVL